MSFKKWIYWAVKAFVNDCSIGFALIALGFIGGLCFNILWNYFLNLLNRF
jgi:hypothetical protein